MDVRGERRMRRFGLALRQNLATLDAKQKIFQKDHNFNKRALKRDLVNSILSRRRMVEGDLDAWESKKAVKSQELFKSIEKIAETVEKEKLAAVSDTHLPAIKSTVPSKESKVSKSLENVFLPKIKTLSEGKSLQSLVSDILVNNNSSTKSSERRTSLDIQLDWETKGKRGSRASISDLPVIHQEPEVEKTSKFKTSVREINTTTTHDANASTDRKVQDENSDNDSPKEIPSSWRRLSIAMNINTGRRLSIRRQSMTPNQVMHSFIEALQKRGNKSDRSSEEEKKKYDLSYLKECRYLRHSMD